MAQDEKRRGRPRDEAIDAQIVDALFELIEELGLGAVTIDAIAERAGVSKATIYRRWDSKEDLIVDSVAHEIDVDDIPETGDTRLQLLTAVHRIRSVMFESKVGSVFPWMIGEVAAGSELGRRYAESVIAPSRQRLAGWIGDAVARGELRSDLDIDLAIDTLTGTLVANRIIGASRPSDEKWAERLVDMLLDGWGPTG